MDVTAAPRFRPHEWAALGLVLMGALALRMYELDRIPPVVIHDECDNLLSAYRILYGKGPGFFGLDWKPQPAASVYLLSLFQAFDPSLYALRLPSALFSVATLVPFYRVLRYVAGPPASLLTTGLLASDIWYLHFSRAGWENVWTCLLLVGALLSLRDALRTGRLRSFLAVGLFSALGAYAYFAGRTVLPTVLVAAAIAFARPQIARVRLASGTLLAAIVAAALFAPQVRSIASNWDRFQSRTRVVFILGADSPAKTPSEKAAVVAWSFFDKLGQLFAERFESRLTVPHRYLRRDGGAFPRVTVVLIGVGMIVSLLWLRETWLWWIFFLIPFFLTQALARGSLNGARAVIVVPILYLFAGVTIHSVWILAGQRYRHLRLLVVAAAIALGTWSTGQYLRWARSPSLLYALEPYVSLPEFPAWQRLAREAARAGRPFSIDAWQQRKRGESRERPD